MVFEMANGACFVSEKKKWKAIYTLGLRLKWRWPSALAGRAHFEVRPGLTRGLLGPGIKCQRRRETPLGRQRARGGAGHRRGPARPGPAPPRPVAAPGPPAGAFPRHPDRTETEPSPGPGPKDISFVTV